MWVRTTSGFLRLRPGSLPQYCSGILSPSRRCSLLITAVMPKPEKKIASLVAGVHVALDDLLGLVVGRGHVGAGHGGLGVGVADEGPYAVGA